MIQEKLQFFSYQIKTPETKPFVYRRQAVAAGKRTAPAAFIINDPVVKILQILIWKRNLAKIHDLSPSIMDDLIPLTECDSPDLFQAFFMIHIISGKFQKGFFPFPHHHSVKYWIPCKKGLCIKRNLRSSCPERYRRKHLFQVFRQFLYKRDIPDIAGKADHIRLFLIQIFHDLILLLIDGVLF